MTDLSVIIPTYGCHSCLRELHARLGAAIEPLTGSYELVFVEDRGEDGSWEFLCELARTDDRVRAFRLSRNFGQHAAITAGLAQSRGRHAVVIDCDLQDPPEVILGMYAKASEGFEVVFGRRRSKASAGHRRLFGRIYYGLMNTFAGAGADPQQGTFSMISRKVIDAYLRMHDAGRQYLFGVRRLGFPSAVVTYDQAERRDGRSSYTLGKLVSHGLDGVFFQSTVLLRRMVYAGAGLLAIGLGFASRVLATSGLVVGGIGITGVLAARARGHPRYVIDAEAGAGTESRVGP